MIKTIMKKLGFNSEQKKEFSAKVFKDDLAETIDWWPLETGGSSYATHFLKVTDENRVSFIATWINYILIFIFIGIPLPLLFIIKDIQIRLYVYIIFLAVIRLFIKMKMPIYFDKTNNIFYKGYKNKFLNLIALYGREKASLKDIYALQIVSEHCCGENSHYYSYELNLVLKNGNRIQVVDYGNYKKLLEDAKKLSEFLGRPIWDSVANKG